MANVIKWVDRIGETKEVNGITFTIVEVEPDSTRLIVEDSEVNDLHVTTRSTWRNGKLANVLREIKKVTMVKTKEVNGLLFEILEIAKNKFTIMVTGKDKLTGKEVEHMTEITKNVWEKGAFVKVFREIGIKIVRQLKRKKAVLKAKWYVSNVLLLNAPQELDFINELKTTYDLKTLKRVYRDASKKFHPDMGGDENKFKLVNVIYKIRKEVFESSISAFGYIDRDIADMTEQLTKQREEINY